MKPEKLLTALEAAVLAFVFSLGTAGVFLSGFDLTLTSTIGLVLSCAAASLLGAALFSWKHGGPVLLCIAALAFGWLWRRGEAWEQLLGLVYRISYIYDRAYHWGYLRMTNGAWDAGLVDLPVAVWSCLSAIAVSYSVSRGRETSFALLTGLIPAALCFVVTDTVPNETWLFVLMAAAAMMVLTASVRSDKPFQGTRLALFAAVPVILALAILFRAAPQESYVNHSKEIQTTILNWVEDIPQMMEQSVSRLTSPGRTSAQQELDLASLGRRIESTQVVMEVTAQESGTLYLRSQDFDAYDGTGWTATPHRSEVFYPASEPGSSVTVKTQAVHDMLFLPYYPGTARQLAGGMVRNTDGLTEYTLMCSTLPDNWQEPARTVENTSEDQLSNLLLVADEETVDRRYLELPIATREAARQLLEGVLDDGYTNTEKAEIIRAMVRTCAEYDRDPDRMPKDAGDFALWFLEDGNRGYCVHFATTAAVLLRAADVPARYVTGYMVEAEAGKTVKVTGANAHAWAEYYEPMLDTWIVLEATPAEDTPAPTASEPQKAPQPEAPQPTQPRGTTPSPTQTADTEAPTTPPPAEAKTPQTRPLGWLLPPAALALALPVQRDLRRRLRRLNRSAGPNARALALWQEAERLGKLLKEAPPEALRDLAQKAKYSQHTLTEEELAQFTAWLRSARRQLQQLPWYIRLVHQYIYAAY